jgi:hypothetical protein
MNINLTNVKRQVITPVGGRVKKVHLKLELEQKQII